MLEIVHNKVVNEPEAISADHVLKVTILYCAILGDMLKLGSGNPRRFARAFRPSV